MRTGVKLRATSNRRVRDNAPYHGKAAFSLIEMIGVMAIMAILATVLVPNTLKMIERTAVRAEAETLRNLGEQAKLYLRDNAAVPPAATWNTAIATYSSLNSTDILTNKRQMSRVYVLEPGASPQRALMISSMRSGLLRQAAPPDTSAQVAAYVGANINRFNDVWNWIPSAVPFAAPAGWGAWNIDNIEYLLIERINFSQVYRTDLVSYSCVLNNQSTTATVRYRFLNPNGTTREEFDLGPRTATVPSSVTKPLNSRERLILLVYPGPTIDYTYTGATTNKTFEFSDVTRWRAL